jgi:hypothetical protein
MAHRYRKSEFLRKFGTDTQKWPEWATAETCDENGNLKEIEGDDPA